MRQREIDLSRGFFSILITIPVTPNLRLIIRGPIFRAYDVTESFPQPNLRNPPSIL